MTEDQLNDLPVAELQEIARELDIEGRSKLDKEGLVSAIIEKRSGNPLPPPVSLENSGATNDERLAAIENRLAAVEARVTALNARTLPSTQILGSDTST